ncbi:MAG TPA: DMT family transporter [Anaerolineaceae bacterium]|nr:DMT family transporter [Anaerolineaceae bacterium]
MKSNQRLKGIQAAVSSAIFMGMVPIFGKKAMLFGFSPFAVITFRTGVALLLLLILMLAFQRRHFYIYFVGLVGCLLAGFVNGLGSILYYVALSRLDASVGQFLYSFYPLFLAFWLLIDRQTINRLTIFRLVLSIPGIFLLICTGFKAVDITGALLMLGSALLYALHLLINQRVLYEVPAPTVTFYTLLAMFVTVVPTYLIFDPKQTFTVNLWWPVLAMAAMTFFSRITLFTGVKHLGGLQTAILGLGELIVTIVLAQFWLGERLSTLQWVGAFLLTTNLLLVGFDKFTPEKRLTSGILSWLNPPKIPSTDIPWQS